MSRTWGRRLLQFPDSPPIRFPAVMGLLWRSVVQQSGTCSELVCRFCNSRRTDRELQGNNPSAGIARKPGDSRGPSWPTWDICRTYPALYIVTVSGPRLRGSGGTEVLTSHGIVLRVANFSIQKTLPKPANSRSTRGRSEKGVVYRRRMRGVLESPEDRVARRYSVVEEQADVGLRGTLEHL